MKLVYNSIYKHKGGALWQTEFPHWKIRLSSLFITAPTSEPGLKKLKTEEW